MRRLFLTLLFGCIALSSVARAGELPSFQALVDALEEGETLSPPAGVYAGPVIVSDPITIDGRGEVTIDNRGKGTVILLDTDGATIKGLRLTNSGSSANDLDSAVQVRGNFNVIKDNVMDEVLFGVDLQQSSNNIVRRNRISSISRLALGQREIQYACGIASTIKLPTILLNMYAIWWSGIQQTISSPATKPAIRAIPCILCIRAITW
jgi:parallel beta-helix repeat protein